MGPPNEPVNPVPNSIRSASSKHYFDLSDGKLSVEGIPLLSEVPANVTLSPFHSICQPSSCSDVPSHLVKRIRALSHKAGFLGFSKEEPSDILSNSLGRFSNREFLTIFRFKPWWATMWVGKSGSDLQIETQWVLLNVPEINSYVIIIPIIEDKFRSALRAGPDDHVIIVAESGSTQVQTSYFNSIAYVHASENPYTLMKEAYSSLRVHLDTFRLLEEKTVPSLVDKVGWCTWDAFYLTVEPVGVYCGLNEFFEAGVSPRFLIIDDGWQSVACDNDETPNPIIGGSQMTGRLYRFEECDKFRNYRGGSLLGPDAPSYDSNRQKRLICKAYELEDVEKARDRAIQSGVTDLSEFKRNWQKHKQELDVMIAQEEKTRPPASNNECDCKAKNFGGMKAFTRDLRTKFKGLDDIYAWHALCGAWGGVRPGTTHLNSKLTAVKASSGLDAFMTDQAMVKIQENGIALVHPRQAEDLFNSIHSYLSEVGITGVKVDAIHSLELVCEEHGGRVELAKAYYKGLSSSLVKNFNGTGLICSMHQCNDFLFLGTKQISFGRVGDDFWVRGKDGDPMEVYWLQGVHMIHCAYNSMWMGQFIQPDWDMFHSLHPCGKFHAASRAICGGPVCLSDSVGCHDFDLIKNIVYPDGTIPKCQHFALPTRDCLFKSPLYDSKSALKIWNLNKYGGVVGAFNCQGAGWDPKKQRIRGFPECYKEICSSVHVTEVEWDQKKEAAHLGKAKKYVVYLNQADVLVHMTPKSDPIQIMIKPSSFEIFTFVPVLKLIPSNTKFAPVGLSNMFNSGGSIRQLEYKTSSGTCSVMMKVKGGGNFLAYSSESPNKCCLNGVDVSFGWSANGKLTLNLPWIEEAAGISDVVIEF